MKTRVYQQRTLKTWVVCHEARYNQTFVPKFTMFDEWRDAIRFAYKD